MKIYRSDSREDTVSFAAEFAKTLPKGAVIAFLGGMGAGKTAFVSGLAFGLGIKDDVSSPTFAICNRYETGGRVLYHYDMYRVNGWDDLYTTGYFDCIESGAYVAVEWAENIFGALPDDCVVIDIKKLSDNGREFRICNKEEIK